MTGMYQPPEFLSVTAESLADSATMFRPTERAETEPAEWPTETEWLGWIKDLFG